MTRQQLQHRRAVAKTKLVPLPVAAERLSWTPREVRRFVRDVPEYATKINGRWFVRVGLVEFWEKVIAESEPLVAEWKRLNGAV